MTRHFLGMLAGLALAVGGCSSGAAPADGGQDGNTIHDLATGDTAGGAGAIGAACKTTMDCAAGKTPVCFIKNFDNKTGNVGTRGGYCSSACVADADCGPGATCTDFGTGKFCIATCAAATDCRAFYACFSFGCFPSDNLTCDPTMNNGTCDYAGRPGGCVRQALGTGNKGQCSEGCAVGTNTCAPDSNKNARHCQEDDERYNTDGTKSNDLWLGPICLFDPTNITPIADGLECKFTNPDATISHFTDICVDGDECYIKGKAPAGMGFDAAGDNLCHRLCYLGNMTPSMPDAGFDFSDGGMIAGTCTVGTCTNIWGAGTNVGFCK